MNGPNEPIQGTHFEGTNVRQCENDREKSYRTAKGQEANTNTWRLWSLDTAPQSSPLPKTAIIHAIVSNDDGLADRPLTTYIEGQFNIPKFYSITYIPILIKIFGNLLDLNTSYFEYKYYELLRLLFYLINRKIG